eukprot:CAMPEP_0114990992 /NCGR_PEP_ID=MMETSP0216-20121206/11112_1 /TAXON_ID=223996 /ORGANISM="Protocruzia adherens, Strain Boccale" /LENGTH=66 /DNA_ID=CAMNT_0002354245 /DNA_START=28 /DNA_END=228 /DNA_ORIENTATION=+
MEGEGVRQRNAKNYFEMRQLQEGDLKKKRAEVVKEQKAKDESTGMIVLVSLVVLALGVGLYFAKKM